MQILFLGPPGAGKGTQSKRLAECLRVPHLSSGDLLREAARAQSPAGKVAKSYMDKGVLVPDEVLIKMFRDKLTAAESKRGFILDGFPRTCAQAAALDKLLADLHRKLSAVILLEVDEKLIVERITGRRTCSNKNCNALYHVKFKPPSNDMLCDVCGSNLLQRSDDRAEVVEERLQAYRTETEPLIEYYAQTSPLLRLTGADDPGTIFANILSALKIPA